MLAHEIGRSTGRRFYVSSLLSAALLVTGLWLVWTLGAAESRPSMGRLVDEINSLSAPEVTAISLLILFVGMATNPFGTWLVKVAEGYWPSIWLVDALRTYGLARFERRRACLQLELRVTQLARVLVAQGITPPPALAPRVSEMVRRGPALAELDRRLEVLSAHLRALPPHGRLMPTRLGNVLRHSEDFAASRYGIPGGVTAIGYLTPLMPPEFAGRLEDSRQALEQLVRMSAYFGVLAAAALMLLADDGVWSLLTLPLLALCSTAYRGAVRTATNYGQLMIIGVDLFRYRLFDSLRLPRPQNWLAEADAFEQAFALIRGDGGPSIEYVADPPSGTISGVRPLESYTT